MRRKGILRVLALALIAISTAASLLLAQDRQAVDWPTLKAVRERARCEQLVKETHERETEQKLKKPVHVDFHEQPLNEILEQLASAADVKIHIDRKGLAEEGVRSDTPVTIQLHNGIMLKSALNLILAPLQLSYIVVDDVVKVTDEQTADPLSLSVPNFTTSAKEAKLILDTLNSSLNRSASSFGLVHTPLEIRLSEDKSEIFVSGPRVECEEVADLLNQLRLLSLYHGQDKSDQDATNSTRCYFVPVGRRDRSARISCRKRRCLACGL